MKEQFRERECVHRAYGVEGDYYRGDAYVQQLMQLKSERAVKFAGKVTSFFWADAAHVIVWLCHDCASELGLEVREASCVS